MTIGYSLTTYWLIICDNIIYHPLSFSKTLKGVFLQTEYFADDALYFYLSNILFAGLLFVMGSFYTTFTYLKSLNTSSATDYSVLMSEN